MCGNFEVTDKTEYGSDNDIIHPVQHQPLHVDWSQPGGVAVVPSASKDPILEQCPFCALSWQSEGNLKFVKWQNDHHWVHCEKCNSNGPTGKTQQEAADLWNDRPVANYLRKQVSVEGIRADANAKGWQAATKLAQKLDKKVKKLKAKVRILRRRVNDAEDF